MEPLDDFKHILDNVNDYALIQVESTDRFVLYNITSPGYMLIDATPEILTELISRLKSKGIKIASSVDEVRDLSVKPFYLKWDEEKKDFVKVYRG